MADTTTGRPAGNEAEELAGLVRGREPQAVVDGLEELARRLRRGEAPTAADDALLAGMRARYARELRELERPEW